jgi:DNA-directed RNA polymerase specialized sigma subunit
MSLDAVTDAYLAARAANGDSAAFAELARRYRPLIVHVTRVRPAGLELDDARQVALVGLFQARK